MIKNCWRGLKIPRHKEYNQIINDVFFKVDSDLNLSKKYDVSIKRIEHIKKQIEQLKYPPKIKDGKIVCYKCDDKLEFHHNHKTGRAIALICRSCNRRIGNNEIEYESILTKPLYYEEKTTITIYESTQKRLKDLRIYKRETYNEILSRLMKDSAELKELKKEQ